MMTKNMQKLQELLSDISKSMSINCKKMRSMLLKRSNKRLKKKKKLRKRRKRKKLSKLPKRNLLLMCLEIKSITLENNTVKKSKRILYKKPSTMQNVSQL